MGIENNAKDMVGKAKEALGDALNNEKMERQGEVDQTDAQIGKAGDAVKDKADDLGDGAKDLAHKTGDKIDDAKDAIDRKL